MKKHLGSLLKGLFVAGRGVAGLTLSADSADAAEDCIVALRSTSNSDAYGTCYTNWPKENARGWGVFNANTDGIAGINGLSVVENGALADPSNESCVAMHLDRGVSKPGWQTWNSFSYNAINWTNYSFPGISVYVVGADIEGWYMANSSVNGDRMGVTCQVN